MKFQDFLASFGFYGIGENNKELIKTIQEACSTYPFLLVCFILANLYGGFNHNELFIVKTNIESQKTKNYYIILQEKTLSQTHSFPSGVSLKSLLHYSQILAGQNFQKFDYGPQNFQIYNSTQPPEYDVSKIRVPSIHLFYGKNDFLAEEQDLVTLLKKLKTQKSMKEIFRFGHGDFVSGRHAHVFYQNVLLKYLNKCLNL